MHPAHKLLMPSHHVAARLIGAMRGAGVVSQNQAKSDSRLLLMINSAQHRLSPFSVALGHALAPARGKRVRACLRDELADDLRGRPIEVRGQRFERLPRRIIKPQHEALAIAAGLMGALFGLPFWPAGGEVRHADVPDHVAQPWGDVHACRGCCLLDSRMKVGGDVAVEVMDRALGMTLVERSCVLTAQTPAYDGAQDLSARTVEVFGKVIHFLPHRRVQAGIHADAGAWLGGLLIR